MLIRYAIHPGGIHENRPAVSTPVTAQRHAPKSRREHFDSSHLRGWELLALNVCYRPRCVEGNEVTEKSVFSRLHPHARVTEGSILCSEPANGLPEIPPIKAPRFQTAGQYITDSRFG